MHIDGLMNYFNCFWYIFNIAKYCSGTDYDRVGCYPDETTSSSLSIQNLFQFRKRNWRFDTIGGLLYLLIAHPLFTGCSLASAVVTTNATTTTMGAAAESLVGFFSDVVFVGLPKLLSSSTLSVVVVLVLYVNSVFMIQCWLYSLCNVQYRPHYENTGLENFGWCIYTYMYLFIFYLMCTYKDEYEARLTLFFSI